jgi:hypothetical protein
LDKAFGFAVGIGRVGLGTDEFDLKSAAGVREGEGLRG